jgi:hypothetical protein
MEIIAASLPPSGWGAVLSKGIYNKAIKEDNQCFTLKLVLVL